MCKTISGSVHCEVITDFALHVKVLLSVTCNVYCFVYRQMQMQIFPDMCCVETSIMELVL
jgi:hypothetical protein